jgi:hypothetical protein
MSQLLLIDCAPHILLDDCLIHHGNINNSICNDGIIMFVRTICEWMDVSSSNTPLLDRTHMVSPSSRLLVLPSIHFVFVLLLNRLLASVQFGALVGIADICVDPDTFTEAMVLKQASGLLVDRNIVRYYITCPVVKDVEQIPTPPPPNKSIQLNSSDGTPITGHVPLTSSSSSGSSLSSPLHGGSLLPLSSLSDAHARARMKVANVIDAPSLLKDNPDMSGNMYGNDVIASIVLVRS